MKKIIIFPALLAFFALFGAGCTQTKTPSTTGLKLLTTADSLDGTSVTYTDPSNGIKFNSILPPTFSDNNGKYLGQKSGESIEIQIGVGGTLEKDRQLYGEVQGLINFEDSILGDWKITTAYDTAKQRWVARALLPDPVYSDRAYHVIECLSAANSDKNFWDSCRTMVENARIITTQTEVKKQPPPQTSNF